MTVRLMLTAGLAVLALPALAQERSILMQSTTSTANSGLYDHLLPRFADETGIKVRVVAVGTGQAIKNAQNCDGDVLFVHAKPDEEKFVKAGYGLERHDVMYNDFVIIGPESDPAGIAGMTDADEAFARIADAAAPFASRGDDSGTNRAELRLWEEAGVDAASARPDWYRETGSGMGATINVAIGMGAYTLTDRATWAAFGDKSDFRILVEGDPALHNQYGVVAVSPEHCPDVKAEGAQRFVDWVISPEGQQAIADFRIDGQQMFFPNAATGD